ncbi:MAG: primase-helicase zinc-binding domain-containing protein [Albidovulum sp.]|uniref:DUF7146 domain-containing protein n=1 Tax=Albidovulum sp. TaxID=1872424 RepID=UPI003CB32CE7
MTDLARGKWKGVLATLGVPEEALQNKHGPCPMCGGSDRFRWDNKDQRGTYICNQCGAGDGMKLLMAVRQWDFATAAREVEAIIGRVAGELAPRAPSEDENRKKLREVLSSCRPIQRGDPVDRYLSARGLEEHIYPSDLLTCERCWFEDGVFYPAMVAIVRDAFGKEINLHRTFLGDGCKAPVDSPRRFMPGTLGEGSCIRLGPVNRILGIAEGIETALAASHRFMMPVWSALNAAMLQKWVPPLGVEEIVIYGDNDENFTGQAAAYSLAHRFRLKGIAASVSIPLRSGTDWADYI